MLTSNYYFTIRCEQVCIWCSFNNFNSNLFIQTWNCLSDVPALGELGTSFVKILFWLLIDVGYIICSNYLIKLEFVTFTLDNIKISLWTCMPIAWMWGAAFGKYIISDNVYSQGGINAYARYSSKNFIS